MRNGICKIKGKVTSLQARLCHGWGGRGIALHFLDLVARRW